MKHLEAINEFFGKRKNGDTVLVSIIKVIKDENLTLNRGNMGAYHVDIDDKIYSFSGGRTTRHLSIYDKSSRIVGGKYDGVVPGKPISKYDFSNKYWKELNKIYDDQQIPDIDNDLNTLDPVTRGANKYNI